MNKSKNSVSGRQCRAARGLLGISQTELAEAAEVSITAIKDFETGLRQPRNATLAAIRRALEEAGVVLIPFNGGGEGVRLKAQPDDSATADDERQ